MSAKQELVVLFCCTLVAGRKFTLIYLVCIQVPLSMAFFLPLCWLKVFKQSIQLGGNFMLGSFQKLRGAKESLCFLFVLEGRKKGRWVMLTL